MSFSGWHSVRYHAIFYPLMAGSLIGLGLGLFFWLLPVSWAALLSALIIAYAAYSFTDSYKADVLGPSIYSNGISLVSKNPFRYHGKFIKFSEIKLVRIGLDDSAFDLAFLQRYLDGLGSRFVRTAKEAMEDMSGTTFLELRSGEIVELGLPSEEERFISILKDSNVKYVVSQEVQKWMDILSEDWEG